MRLWPIMWAQERLPPAWVATSLLRLLFEESIHSPWQMGWRIVLSSGRPEGLMVLVRRTALLLLQREQNCLLVAVARR